MGVPDDANPMNRSLPAEVVKRQRKEQKNVKGDTRIEIDRSQVLAMKGDSRVKWLGKVLHGFQQGRVQSGSIYDIVADSKFARDIPEKIGVKLYRIVNAHLHLFSAKQKRFLEAESKLAQQFREAAKGRGQEDRDDDDEKGGDVTTSVTKDEVPALWERLTTLSAEERAAAVDALDSQSKELLEDFLVDRIGARNEDSGEAVSLSEGDDDDKNRAVSESSPKRVKKEVVQKQKEKDKDKEKEKDREREKKEKDREREKERARDKAKEKEKAKAKEKEKEKEKEKGKKVDVKTKSKRKARSSSSSASQASSKGESSSGSQGARRRGSDKKRKK